MLGNVFILGDSYSTFEGYIPDGYVAYYKEDGPQYIEEFSEMKSYERDVFRVEQTWWYDFVRENGKLLTYCST